MKSRSTMKSVAKRWNSVKNKTLNKITPSSIIYGFNLRAQDTELSWNDTIWLKTGEVLPCTVEKNDFEGSTVSARYIGSEGIITFRQFSKYEIDQIKFGDEIIYNKKPGKPGLKKNAIYVSAGTFGAPYRFINGSFERAERL